MVPRDRLHIEVGLDPIEITFTLRTDNRPMVNLEPRTHGFKIVGDVGAPAIGDQALGRPIVLARGIQHHESRPRGFRRGQRAGQDGTGVPL